MPRGVVAVVDDADDDAFYDTSVQAQLSQRTITDGDCQIWTAQTTESGLPLLELYRHGRRVSRQLAHRVSFDLANGPLRGNQRIRNTCGRRICINPDHWELV